MVNSLFLWSLPTTTPTAPGLGLMKQYVSLLTYFFPLLFQNSFRNSSPAFQFLTSSTHPWMPAKSGGPLSER